MLQHAPRQPGPPFFLYEQVFVPGTPGIAMLRDVPHHLKEDACLVMDAGWDFSCARRLRIYCTNMRGHARHALLPVLTSTRQHRLALAGCAG